MASRSLGTLTLDLIARVGGFVGGMNEAERASQAWRNRVESDVKVVTAGMAAAGAAALAAGTAGFALLKSTSEQISETDRWAKSLKISTQELLAWQYAAENAGLAGENINDIFKDISDKIGDAIINKSGDAVDALDALGLSADKLAKASPDQQLLAIGEAVGKIDTNAGKITILESLGNDLSKLLPLFDNNNKKLKEFILQAKDYGIAPDQSSIDDLVRVNDVFEDMEDQVRGLKMEIAGGLAQVDLSPLNKSLDEVRDVLTDPEVLKGIVALVSQVAELAGWLVKAAAGAGKLAASSSDRAAVLGGKVDMSNPDQIQQRIDWLEKSTNGRSDGMYGGGQSFFGWLSGKDDSLKAINAELDELYAQRERLSKQRDIVVSPDITPDTAASLLNFSLPEGQTNGKTTPDAGAKKLDSAFKATETSYLRQIALIDTTGKKVNEVTELQKLQFDMADGKLSGINASQQKRLEQLAQEVDRLNDVKKANEENAKVAELVANLNAQNQNAREDLNVDVQGAGMGDKERDRMKERLSIERSFLEQQRQLQQEYAKTGDKSLYDKETAELSRAMEERLKIQEDHYKSMDAMQSDWSAGVSDGLANWLDTSSNYSASAASVVSSTMDSALDNVAAMLVGNKASWKDWASSILTMIAKIALQMAAVNLVSGIVSSVGSSALGAASAGSGSANNAFSGGAYSNLTLNAKGGVYSSHDLSAYSGQVVSSPTMFAFAKGAGLMGEAGPEAIMPLTRAADGSLGVRAVSGGSGGGTSIEVNAPVTIQGGGSGGVSSDNTTGVAKQLQAIVQTTITDRLKREMSPGGMLFRA